MEDVCLELAVGPGWDVFTWGPFVFTGRLGDPESAGAAEIVGVRSRSDADFRDAEVLVGNNSSTGFNTPGFKKRFRRSSEISGPVSVGPQGISEHAAGDFSGKYNTLTSSMIIAHGPQQYCCGYAISTH